MLVEGQAEVVVVVAAAEEEEGEEVISKFLLFPTFKTAGDLIRLVEVGPQGYSPVWEWESEGTSASRTRAWGSDEDKELKKVKSYVAMYTIAKLAVHWGTLLETSPVIAAHLKGAASGAFVLNSAQLEKAATFLQNRHIPNSIKSAFESLYKGGYAAASKEAHLHVLSCTDAHACGRQASRITGTTPTA